jgi:hypothetical protein
VKAHLSAAIALIAILQQSAAAQDVSELAKASQNPVGDLTALPVEIKFLAGGGLTNGSSILNVNFEPVIPLAINQNWNVIVRTIFPYLSFPGPQLTRVTGLGDVKEQLFFSPSHPGALLWGVGPVFSFPTATNGLATTGSWAAGPSAVVLKFIGPLVLGTLAFNVWTFADNDHRPPEVNGLSVQPFFELNLPDGWAFGSSPSITANWDAPSGEKWTVPLGLGISKVTLVGPLPMLLGIDYYNNVKRPTGATKTEMRFLAAVLFPKMKKQ